MNLFKKYYASIIGLIRFLGIGVGNEHARASTIFTITFFPLIIMILNVLGVNTKELGLLLNLILILGVFFICYLLFSKDDSIETINIWLVNSSLKEKLLSGVLSLSFFLTIIIIFLKFYA
tara:strand:+ start:401 stop:760 length:360 start_codon:yes stop_codon:yes gene_type:complete